MRKLRIYLDSSVVSFLFAQDVPEFRRITEELFDRYISPGKYIAYVSDVVIREIEKTRDQAKRLLLLGVIRDYALRILTLTEEAHRLAQAYVEEKIIPPGKLEDAQHIAIATCSQIDVLLSWNFKHVANIQKQIAVRAVNERRGYFYPITLTNPMEVLYGDD